MNIKDILLISIILLAIFSISAVSAENVADANVEMISGDINSNNCFDNVLSDQNEDNRYGDEANEVVEDSSNVTSSIESSDLVKYYKNDSQYEATFYDFNGTPLVNQSIPISINGGNYNRTTNTSGMIKFSINLVPGNYTLKVTNPVTNQTALNNINVLSTLITKDVVKSIKTVLNIMLLF